MSPVAGSEVHASRLVGWSSQWKGNERLVAMMSVARRLARTAEPYGYGSLDVVNSNSIGCLRCFTGVSSRMSRWWCGG